MKANLGNVDKVVRIILGLGLLSLIFLLEGNIRWVGLAGGVLIATVFMSWCPIYAVLGLRTNK